MALMFSFFRALELLQFSMEMNLPVATLRAGIGDIVNWLVIIVFLFYGFSMTGYMVFCTSVEEFATVQTSLFTLIIMITGEFEVLKSMSDKQPIFTPIYFLGFMVTVIVFLANIFIGLVGGHFNREITLLETELNADQ